MDTNVGLRLSASQKFIPLGVEGSGPRPHRCRAADAAGACISDVERRWLAEPLLSKPTLDAVAMATGGHEKR